MVFKKIIFQNRYVELETPPFMEKTILNFHFDYLNTPLTISRWKISDTECRRAKYKLQNTKIIQVYISRSKNTELSSKIL